jgi:excinuclease ABC subunit A
VYTELADWARPRGYTHLRVDGNFLPTTGFPRIDRFKEHTIELPVASLEVSARPTKSSCAKPSPRHLELGKGVVHVLSNLDGLQEAMQAAANLTAQGTKLDKVEAFRPQRTLANCRCSPHCARARCADTSYDELDPRLFSYNSKHGWCPECVGTGVKLTKDQRKVFDDSVQRRRQQRPRAKLCRARN